MSSPTIARTLIASLALCAAAATAVPLAGQTAPADTLPVYLLEGVQVTTTRSLAERARLPEKIVVVTPTDLANTGATTVAEALRSTIAVDVIDYPGLLTGVSVRGFRPQFSGNNTRTLILVDGRPAGTNNLALVHAGAVERIEIIRGPASALYGSSAMGGVVNVITRRSRGDPHADALLGYGSFGGYEGRLRSGGDLGGGFDFDLALNRLGQRGGYRIGSNRASALDSLRKTLPDGAVTRVPWTSSDTVLGFSRFDSRTGAGRIGIALADGWRLDLRGEAFVADDVQNPGDLGASGWDSRSLKDVARRSLDLGLSGALGRHAPTLRAYSALERVDYYSQPEAPKHVSLRTPTLTYGLQAQDVIGLRSGILTVGADYTAIETASERYTDHGMRAAPFNPNSAIHSAAAFAQGRLEPAGGRLVVSAGARVDRVALHVRDTPELSGYPANSAIHAVFTPNLGVRFLGPAGTQLYGNAGRAFVTPDAFAVAGYVERRAGDDRSGVFVTRGNPTLRPETSRGWDAGVAVRRPRQGIEVEVGYFATVVRDRITTRTGPGSPSERTAAGDSVLTTTSYLNADAAAIRGVEARASYDLGAVLGYRRSFRAFTDAIHFLVAEERLAGAATPDRIRNVAVTTLVWGLDYDDLRRVSGRVTARHVGPRVDSDHVAWWAPGEISYPPYRVVDVSGAVRLGERYRLGLELRNLTDQDYFEVRGYPLPGRSARATVRVQF
jgi:vitamin B12 transporter